MRVMLLTGFVVGSGCVRSNLTPEGKALRSEHYETVYSLGSHIPKRVARGAEVERNDGASPVAVLEGEAARDAVRTMQRKN